MTFRERVSLLMVGTLPRSRLKSRVRFSASRSTCLTLRLVRSSSEGGLAAGGAAFSGRLLFFRDGASGGVFISRILTVGRGRGGGDGDRSLT